MYLLNLLQQFKIRHIVNGLLKNRKFVESSILRYEWHLYSMNFYTSQHGMGIPSVSILLHEIIKLMYHAKVSDPIFFRIGTCGGIGIDGGNVIITEEALNSDLKPYQELVRRNTYIPRKRKCPFYPCILLLFPMFSSMWPKVFNFIK